MALTPTTQLLGDELVLESPFRIGDVFRKETVVEQEALPAGATDTPVRIGARVRKRQYVASHARTVCTGMHLGILYAQRQDQHGTRHAAPIALCRRGPGLVAVVGRAKSQTWCGKAPWSASGTACRPGRCASSGSSLPLQPSNQHHDEGDQYPDPARHTSRVLPRVGQHQSALATRLCRGPESRPGFVTRMQQHRAGHSALI
jgi:hypothetical protein